jgi:transposase
MDVHGCQSPFVRRDHHERVRMCHTTSFRPFLQRVMFWGAISGDGPVALVPITGTMTAMKYEETLENHLVPFLDNQPLSLKYTFQHDNAPCHKAGRTTKFLKDNAIDVLENWPPYSPDLNVIENMWAFIKSKLRRESIGSNEQLRTRALEIWRSDEVRSLCRRLTDSMNERIKLCIASKGGYIKY